MFWGNKKNLRLFQAQMMSGLKSIKSYYMLQTPFIIFDFVPSICCILFCKSYPIILMFECHSISQNYVSLFALFFRQEAELM